jgi:hypothetical protein
MRVARRPPDYALVLGDGELDVERFRALVERARAASAPRRPAEAHLCRHPRRRIRPGE